MIIKESLSLPNEYEINIYISNKMLAEMPNNYLINRKRLQVPDSIRNDKLLRTVNKNRTFELKRFNKDLYKETSPQLINIVNDSVKDGLDYFIENISGGGSGSISMDKDGFMCYAFYVTIRINSKFLTNITNEYLSNRLNYFKIRFAEHISSQEYKSLNDDNSLILNTIYSINEQRKIIENCVNNVIDSRFCLYNYIVESDTTITALDDIDKDIIKNCLKYKKQGNFKE